MPTSTMDGQEAYMRTLAVKYNRSVVQAQIAAYEKQLAKAGDKLTDTKGDVAKSQSRITKSNGQLEKIKAKRAKVERDTVIRGETVDAPGPGARPETVTLRGEVLP